MLDFGCYIFAVSSSSCSGASAFRVMHLIKTLPSRSASV